MAAVALTAAQIAPIDGDKPLIIPVRLAEAVTPGLIGYQLAAGTFGIADANAAGKIQARGVFLQTKAAGEVCDFLIRGRCYGFTVSALDCDIPLYLSDTAGGLDTTAGSTTVICGRISATTESTPTKVIFFNFDWLRTWS